MSAGRVVFDGVWKRFHRGPAHDTLRDLIPAMLGQIRRNNTELGADDFWAVQDASFEVRPGESLGIIGGNGAGKSTVLKLLTGILQPTFGRIDLHGRVGALIEVSAGFHPDLSGRENVFLQGAIMGMPQALIRRRFDEIVEFAGVTSFIDTPVKRYSSGMNARLGFSIAVHLEPDVLIIDEVLSVGDASFQQKAFDRIQEVVRSDIPVVIVSHQLDRIMQLCSECILLSSGRVAARGKPAEVVQRYLRGADVADAAVVGGLQLATVELHQRDAVRSGELLSFSVAGRCDGPIPDWVSVLICVCEAASNRELYVANNVELGMLPGAGGDFRQVFQMRANLATGVYRLETRVWNARLKAMTQGPATFFEVEARPAFNGSVQLSLTTLPD
jgi:ABC-type polysaccharide/polyol phosphate transport system ATPase subunit